MVNWILMSVFMGPPARATVSYTFFTDQLDAGNVQTVTSTGDAIQGEFKKDVVYPPDSKDADKVDLFTTQRPSFADDDLLATLADTRAVAVIDLKGAYRGTPVDVDTDPELYARVAAALPDAWLEDPDLTVPEADEALRPYRDRITWDAPIHSVQDVLALPFAPRTLNVKPSRFGSLERLFDFYDHCEANGIGLYGGGQSELGVGRGQIQVLAALLHPDGSNDIAPAGYDWLEFPPGLDPSPLDPALEPTGFRRRGPAPD